MNTEPLRVELETEDDIDIIVPNEFEASNIFSEEALNKIFNDLVRNSR